MITVIGFGFLALAVLAVAVGLFDAAQAGRRRAIMNSRSNRAWSDITV